MATLSEQEIKDLLDDGCDADGTHYLEQHRAHVAAEVRAALTARLAKDGGRR